jgi:hypothetical protein
MTGTDLCVVEYVEDWHVQVSVWQLWLQKKISPGHISTTLFVYMLQTNIIGCELVLGGSFSHSFYILMMPVRAISTWIGMLDLHCFVLIDSLRMAHVGVWYLSWIIFYWIHLLADIVQKNKFFFKLWRHLKWWQSFNYLQRPKLGG